MKACSRSIGNSVKPVQKWSYNNLKEPCVFLLAHVEVEGFAHFIHPSHYDQTILSILRRPKHQRNFKNQKHAARFVPVLATPRSRQVWWINQQQASDVSPLVALLWASRVGCDRKCGGSHRLAIVWYKEDFISPPEVNLSNYISNGWMGGVEILT